MRLQYVFFGLAGVVALVGGMYIFNLHSQQSRTEQQLKDLTERIDKNNAQGGQTVVIGSATQGATAGERVARMNDALRQGWDLINKREVGSARLAATLFKDAIEKIEPREPQFYNGLGRARLIAGDYPGAIEAFRQGLSITPQLADMHSGIGWAWWRLGDPYRARQAWQKAVELNKKCGDAWEALAWIYLRDGKVQESKAAFAYLLTLQKDNKKWIYGHNLAMASNSRDEAINVYFPLPPKEAFEKPTLPDFAMPPPIVVATSSAPATQPSTSTAALTP